MALINLKDLLNHAKQHKYAVGAFNMTNIDFLDTVIGAAVEQNSPLILQLAEVHFRYLNLEHIAPAIIRAASEVSIPICVHLDHGEKFETVVRAIRAGFTSVMFDGSKYPLEENIAKTKEVIKVARSVGVSVEAELGSVGGEVIGVAAPTPKEANREAFTDVTEAKRFVEETDVDALAVSIGNVHGTYKGDPNLDFEILRQIRDAVDIPLVLHGGSGIYDEDFRKAITLGICKINFYTEMSTAAINKAKEFLSENPDCISYPDLARIAMEEAKAKVKDRMVVFGSKNICASEKTLCLTCEDTSCSVTDPRMQPEANTVIYSKLVESLSNEIISSIVKAKLK